MNKGRRYFLSFLMIFATVFLVACTKTPIKIVIYFDSNGGTDVSSISYDGTSDVVIPENPTKDNYEFVNWYWDNDIYELPFTIDSAKDRLNQEDTELTLYAKWTPVNYSVTYVLDGGNNNPNNPSLFNIESNLELLEPTRQGYSFDGWYTDASFGSEFDFETIEIENVTVYAKWSTAIYTLQFVDEDDEIVQTADYAYGADLSDIVSPSLTKVGYTFSGWDTIIPETMPSSNLTFRALYQANQYTITFDVSGGSSIETITGDYNSVIEEPVPPIKEGYTFDGWYSDIDFETAYVFQTIPAEDITLYAKWNVNSYTISFINDDETIIQSTNHEYHSILDVAIPEIDLVKVGYTFVGWEDILPTLMPAEDLLIHPLFQINQYRITYITNGGSEIQDLTYDYDSLIAIPIIEKEGYTIEGWYIDEALTNLYIFGNMPAEDILLYAKWQLATYTITYHLDGGSNHEKNIAVFTAETENFIYSSPDKKGNSFIGWYQEPDLSGEKVQYFVLGTSADIILYAKWAINQYNIDYYIDDDYDPIATIKLYPNEFFISVSLGSDHSAALTSNGRLFTWGRNNFGQLGNGTLLDIFRPVDITDDFNLASDEQIVSISLGYSHSSALTSSGRLFTWGYNLSGQLGDGTLTNKNKPVDITNQFNLTTNEKILSVLLQGEISSVSTSTNRIFIWGRNSYGQIGDGTTTNRNKPIDITLRFDLNPGETVQSLSLGVNHASAISSTNRIFTWGWNTYGQLGDGTTTNKNKPTDITTRFILGVDETIENVSLGTNHSSAISSLNRIFTWGWNSNGQLGDGSVTNKNRPTDITSRFNFNEAEIIENISLGSNYSAISTSLGRIFSWGNNASGQLGDETTIQRTTPVEISAKFNLRAEETVVSISLGANHSSAVTSIGRMFTWGKNQYSQLGNGATVDQTKPVELLVNNLELIVTESYDYESSLIEYIPIKEGFIFSGWYLKMDMTMPYSFDTMKEEDVLLAGYWIADEYTIIYHLDGGTNSINNPLTYTIETNTIQLETITKEGYNFLGWYENDTYEGNALSTILEGSTGNLTLYAKWEINLYTLSFEENGGSIVSDITAHYGTPLIQPATPIRQGYNFAGWYSNASLTNQYTFTSMPAENMTLYAKWDSKLNIVTFVFNNGEDNQQVADYSGSMLQIPIYTGYEFGGWYEDQALTKLYGFDTFPTTNKTLYAKWYLAYSITYHLNGGTNNSENPPHYKVVDDTIELLDPIKEGYTFLGWYGHDDFTGDIVTTILQGSTAHMNLYAKWTINSYHIDYYIYEDYDSLAFIILYPNETIEEVFLGSFHSTALTSLGRVFTWGDNGYGQLGDGTTTDQSVPIEITNQFNLATDEMISSISLGANHSTALTSLGRVFTWGDNGYGQLGDGTIVDKHIPVDISSQFTLATDEMILSISLGANHSTALTSFGRVFSWGDNDNGKLGDGTTVDKHIPVDISSQFILATNEVISSISLGANHSSALTSLGSLFTWGDNSFGRLGDGTTIFKSIPTKINNHFNFIGNEEIVSISLGDMHSSVLTSIGRVFTWGANNHGQLGDGTITNRSIPIEITSKFDLSTGETISNVSLGAQHSSALTSQGRVLTWGANSNGQLGDGTTINRYLPQDITSQFNLLSGEAINSISLGSNHSSALSSLGRMFTWGTNSSGQLGDGTKVSRFTPKIIKSNHSGLVQTDIYEYGVPIEDYIPIKVGYTFSGWFTNLEMSIPHVLVTMPAMDTVLYAKWTINSYDLEYYIYDDYDHQTVITLYPNEIVENVFLGDLHSFALTSLGRVFAWGANSYGQLGDGTNTQRIKPIEVTNRFDLEVDEKILSISLGYAHSSALSSSGRFFIWGANSNGQLGDGTIIHRSVPTEITSQFDLQANEKIVSVSLGDYHSSALTSLGRMFTWGNNAFGQLGDGTTTQRISRIEITSRFNLAINETISNVSLGANHSSALTSLGRMFIWGNNTFGQLGDGTTTHKSLPIEITSKFTLEVGETIKNVVLGDLHSTALISSGRMFTWGNNAFGQLGDGTTTLRSTPIEITSKFNLAANETIIMVSLGYAHSSALSSSGRIFTWGKNDFGLLGDGTTIHKSIPTEITNKFSLVTSEKIASVTLGNNHSSALTTSGRLFTWGANSYGQLGDGTTLSRLVPTKIQVNYAKLVKTTIFDYNSTVVAHVPTRVGYTFSGWYRDIEMATPYVFSSMPASDVILYGYWVRNS